MESLVEKEVATRIYGMVFNLKDILNSIEQVPGEDSTLHDAAYLGIATRLFPNLPKQHFQRALGELNTWLVAQGFNLCWGRDGRELWAVQQISKKED